MNARPLLLLAVTLFASLLTLSSLAAAPAGARGALPSDAGNPLTGNLTGPSYVATSSNATFEVNASGGPADVFGNLVGSINFTATVSGSSLNGVAISPPNGTIHALDAAESLNLTVSNVTQTLTIEVRITSTLNGTSANITVTHAVYVVVPYVLKAVVVAGASGVLPFSVLVELDGTRVGNVSVPALSARQSYTITYKYASGGLASGYHTFTLSVANAHGLVSFGGGQSSISSTFYVAGPATNDAIWYVAGAVAFFGALFIFGTRVAARRRGSGKR